MEIDRITGDYLPSPDDKRLYGLHANRIPFSMGHLIVDRYPFLESNLQRALNAYELDDSHHFQYELSGPELASRSMRITDDLKVVRNAMSAICEEAEGTALIEGAENFLRTQA